MAEALLTWAAIDDDISQAAAHSAQALEIMESLSRPDPRVLAGALNQAAAVKFRAGAGLDHQMFKRAIEIERGLIPTGVFRTGPTPPTPPCSSTPTSWSRPRPCWRSS